MNPWLAIEWDAGELRAILARSDAARLSIDRSGAWPLSEADAKDPAAISARIREALAPWNVGRTETILVLGRPSAELRLIQVPPVESNELPDIVRMQSLRQFSHMAESWPVDFSPLPPNTEGGPTEAVLASTISPEALQRFVGTASAAGLNPTRVHLRPFATTALARKLGGEPVCRLFIDRLGSETDLIVATGDKTIYPRSVRLPADEQNSPKVLASESRRTLAAAANQNAGQTVTEVILLGDENRDAALARALDGELRLPVRIVNPLSFASGATASEGEPGIGRFAPLVGACLEASASQRSGIDYLNPRRKPPPPDFRRLYSLMGGAGAAVALLVFGWIWLSLMQLDNRISELSSTNDKLKRDNAKGKSVLVKAAELEKFDRGDVLWLNELERIAQRMPPANDTIVADVTAKVASRGDAQIVVTGRLKDQTKIGDIERALRDDTHKVKGDGLQYNEQLRPFPYFYRETITIDSDSIAASRSTSAPSELDEAKTPGKTPAKASGKGTKPKSKSSASASAKEAAR